MYHLKKPWFEIYYPIIQIILMIPCSISRALYISDESSYVFSVFQTVCDSFTGFFFSGVLIINNQAFQRDIYRWCGKKNKDKLEFSNPQLEYGNNLETFQFTNHENNVSLTNNE